MHVNVLQSVYVYNELLHVSASHVTILSDVKYKTEVH
jgi:hypothetical protein